MLQEMKLKEVAFQVFGGVPAQYFKLRDMIQEAAIKPITASAYQSQFERAITGALDNAMRAITDLRDSFPEFIPILDKLKTEDFVSRIGVKITSEPSPNKALHKFQKYNEKNEACTVYAPVNSAVRLVLREGWDKLPSRGAA